MRVSVLIMGVLAGGTLGAWLGCGGASDAGVGARGDDGGPDGGSSSGAASSGGTSGSNGSSSSGDAGKDGDIVADGGQGGEAGPGGDTTHLPCGAATCAIPNQSCCVTAGGGRSYVCVVGVGCPPAGGGDQAGLLCTSTANCATGQICCVTDKGNNTVSSSCQTACGANDAQLCDPSVANPGCAAGGGNACSNNNIGDWGLPKTFGTCGGKTGPF